MKEKFYQLNLNEFEWEALVKCIANVDLSGKDYDRNNDKKYLEAIQVKLDLNNITHEQLISLRAQYKEGVKHLKYFEDSKKFFKFPEKRLKTFDTVHYERVIPEIKEILIKLGEKI